jgi:hypothetical protein
LAHPLIPWVDACYGKTTALILGGERLDSRRGVQQGDPLGPALFGMAIHEGVCRATQTTRAKYGNQSIELMIFFLDDGVVAGTAEAVADWLGEVTKELAEVGLQLARSKCVVVPAAGEKANKEEFENRFLDMEWNPQQEFKLLGAWFGGSEGASAHVRKRSTKAGKIMAQLGKMEDPQSAVLLLRHCAGFSKILYSTRTVPPAAHREALEEYGVQMRQCLDEVLQKPTDERGWKQAQLSIADGGLGLRNPGRHAGAAYVASVRSTRAKCTESDPNYGGGRGGEEEEEEQGHMGQDVLPNACLAGPAGKGAQKHLSRLVDARTRMELQEGPGADLAYKQHLSMMGAAGAGAWLTAAPGEGREMEAPLFRVALWRRLRLKVQETDTWCPFCCQVFDTFGDHALVCACKGDRTVRHNKIRNLVFEEALRGGMVVEKEKAGLLPGRPSDDGLRTEGEARRPADIWWKDGKKGRSEAWDFAVTSGMKADRLKGGEETNKTAVVVQKYEDFKIKFKDTGSQCEEQGVDFIPMVAEAHGGGMSGNMRARLEEIARRQRCTGVDCEGVEPGLYIAQRFSLCLQAENARAVWRRLPQEREDSDSMEEETWDVEGEGAQEEEGDDEEGSNEDNEGDDTDSNASEEIVWTTGGEDEGGRSPDGRAAAGSRGECTPA